MNEKIKESKIDTLDWNLEGRTASITKNGDLKSSKISVI